MIWNLIAKLLAQPFMVSLIYGHAIKHPYFHITHPIGDVYMGRWWVIKERRWLPFAARLHHIATEDRDRALHDHPYDYRTIILRGGYTEMDVFGRLHERRVGDTVSAGAQTFHKIVRVEPNTLTLFMYRARRESNPWGFMIADPAAGGAARKVHWRTYLADQGKAYPADYQAKRGGDV